MIEKAKTKLVQVLQASGSIRRRIFFLLVSMGLGALLIANLIWLPSVVQEIHQAQIDLRHVSAQFIRDRIQGQLEGNELDLKNAAQRFRPYLVDEDREGLRLTAQRLLQRGFVFEEIGILDHRGREMIRVSRRAVVTDRDLVDRSDSSLFREGMKQEVAWGPVTLTGTSEPWVTLTVRLPGSDPALKGIVFGVINLKSLWNLTREFKLKHEGRVYVVEEAGRLIAAADPSVVLRQISFADRTLIRQLLDPRNSDDSSFVEGSYTNEKGVDAMATGILLTRPRWGIVIEQPRSLLFAPIRQKIGLFIGLSLIGFLFSFGFARMFSRRLTEPIVRLREGAEQVGSGNLEYKVPVERSDEIGELASQFNRMAERLNASQQTTLSALTIPVMSPTGQIREVLDASLSKIMRVTEAQAGSIRLFEDRRGGGVLSVYSGFSDAYISGSQTMARDDVWHEKVLSAGEPFISEDILSDPYGRWDPLLREGFRSAVYLPLQTPNKTFGLVTLASREPGQLSTRKSNLFKVIAHAISVALENIWLFQEAMTSKGELEKLNAVQTQQREELANSNTKLEIEIAERREAERILSAERERLAVTLRSIGDGVITTDVHGHVTMLNNMAEELIGWSHVEAQGRHLSEIFNTIDARSRERCKNPIEKVLKTGGIIDLANHTVLIRRDGKELTIANSGAPIRDRESNIYGVVLVFRDVTDKEKTEQVLQNAQKLEAVGALAAGIAHDFNNLLAGIFGYIELSRVQAEEGGLVGVTRTLSKAIGVFDRAKHLTQQLLTFSKGGIPIRKTMSITEWVNKTVSFALSGSNVSPVFFIPEEPWLCDLDENQMAQVFDNIVINARQAMPMGGKVDVAIRNVRSRDCPKSLPANNYVCISIKDYGIGIVKEHLSQIFVPFFTTKQKGSGLGLATSYAIVKKHDGMIDVESEPGRGSTFHIYLPASSSNAADAPVLTTHSHQGQGRILIMDDEAFILDILALQLERMGYDVAKAEDGDQAIRHAAEAVREGAPFRIAILDLTIPGGRGGKDVVKELLEISPSLKAIASSGYSEDPVMSNPSSYGFVNRLIKPYRNNDIARVLGSAI
jgi:PAS domain S-box-containing protein